MIGTVYHTSRDHHIRLKHSLRSPLVRTPRQGSWKLGSIPSQRYHHLRWKDKPECRDGYVDVAELVDALGLGSSVFGRGGSSPLIDIEFGFSKFVFQIH